MIANLAFDLFAFILLASAVMVISSRNPVHSVMFLILAFINAAALFLLAGAEFLAMILVIVYVGAVAVLFMFVVMMLDVNFAQLREGVQRYAPVGALVGFVLFAELAFIVGGWTMAPGALSARLAITPDDMTNAQALGSLIYTKYIFLFQLAGVILLVSMIGAIVLTLRDRKTGKRQNLEIQHARTPASTLRMVDAKLGEGAKLPEDVL
jgi:NADH-quinone oxidoreductase subunit J